MDPVTVHAEAVFYLLHHFREPGPRGVVDLEGVVHTLRWVPLDSYDSFTTSPYTEALLRLARATPPERSAATSFDLTTLREGTRQLLSFPERLAAYTNNNNDSNDAMMKDTIHNYCYSTDRTVDRIKYLPKDENRQTEMICSHNSDSNTWIDREVFLARLFDAFWWVCLGLTAQPKLASPPVVPLSSSSDDVALSRATLTEGQSEFLLYTIAELAVARGCDGILFERFARLPNAPRREEVSAQTKDPTLTPNNGMPHPCNQKNPHASLVRTLLLFSKGVLAGALLQHRQRVTSAWSRWLRVLLRRGRREMAWEEAASDVLAYTIGPSHSSASLFNSTASEMETALNKNGCGTNENNHPLSTQTHDTPFFLTDALLHKWGRRFLCEDLLRLPGTSRLELRWVFQVLFPKLQRRLVNSAAEAVFQAWNAPVDEPNETLLNAVMYFMQECAQGTEDALDEVVPARNENHHTNQDPMQNETSQMHSNELPSNPAQIGPTPPRKSPRLPPRWLSNLLNGVTHRLDSVHPASQKSGMVAAAGFARLFVQNAEAVEGMLKNESYAAALAEWLEGEKAEPIEMNNKNKSSSGPLSPGEDINTGGFARTELVRALHFPLDPDAPVLFFTPQLSEIGTDGDATNSNSVFNHNNNTNNKDNNNNNVVDIRTPGASTLARFGVQSLPSDHYEGNLLRCFRAAYDALLGIGRGPNAQLYDVQRDLSDGLHGLASILTQLKQIAHRCAIAGSSLSSVAENAPFNLNSNLNPKSNAVVGADLLSQVAALVPSLLPTLGGMQIHAPPEEEAHLYRLRDDAISNLICIAPRAALRELSEMIYAANYAIYQRLTFLRAIAVAAEELASVEIPLDEIRTNHRNTHTPPSGASEKTKRVYPPIDHVHAPSRRTPARLLYPPDVDPNHLDDTTKPTSELNLNVKSKVSKTNPTRRWGYAVPHRAAAREHPRRYLNRLAEAAPFFIAALLARLEQGHFKFFQENDPYAPADVLRTLGGIFQLLRSARHVIAELAEENLSFFIAAVVQHPLLPVRRQAWVVLGEVLRSWAGAPAVVDLNQSSKHKLKYKNSNPSPWPSHSGPSGSSARLILSESWLEALRALQQLASEAARKSDPCADIAILTVAALTDMVQEQSDWARQQRSSNEIISLGYKEAEQHR